ncbi:glycoside hydrolase family 5 protein [Clostridium felsineum]|uniref:glycoside hydrolase family 5 protein n=1 Tax=Clostridium felsineum TaxID=36839 RepID=UPI00098CBEB0|nr:glycoside hydrolase family 5 protein [Clostridium felsineum]MCR3760138.1 glycoside hydrolase family 5 protein [Clostridium felsineum]URZ01533.1 Endoglucanase D [Clostridium felsineum]URZ17426.1 Endoglucanase D [Clostridium felsineum DSM 794]
MFKKLFSKILILFLILAFIWLFLIRNLNPSISNPSTDKKVSNDKLSSLQLVKDMKVGWNLGNTLDSPNNETDWGNPKTSKEMIDKVKQAGFNTVRIPVSWCNHLGPAPDYNIDTTWLDRIQEVVDYAMDNHMYVIINLHKEESWLIPTYAKEADATNKLTKIWSQISNRFKNYNNSLIFEVMNEPRLVGSPVEWSGGTDEALDVVNKFNLAAVNTIRKSGSKNSSRFLMIPTYAASTDSASINALKIPNNDKKILISVHAYLPYNFAMNINGTSTWGSKEDKRELDSTLNTLYNKFVKKGHGVVIGEFGSVNKNNETSRIALAKYYVTGAKKRNIATIWWDNGFSNAWEKDSYGLFDRNTLKWKFPKLLHTLIDSAKE